MFLAPTLGAFWRILAIILHGRPAPTVTKILYDLRDEDGPGRTALARITPRVQP